MGNNQLSMQFIFVIEQFSKSYIQKIRFRILRLPQLPLISIFAAAVCFPASSYGLSYENSDAANRGCSKGAEIYAETYSGLITDIIKYIKSDSKANIKDIERGIRELHEEASDRLFYSQKNERKSWEEQYKGEAETVKIRMLSYLGVYHSSIKIAHSLYLREPFNAISNLSPMTESRILRIVEEKCKYIAFKPDSK